MSSTMINVNGKEVLLKDIQSHLDTLKAGAFREEIKTSKPLIQGLIDKINELQRFKDSINGFMKEIFHLENDRHYYDGNGDLVRVFKIKPDEQCLFNNDIAIYPFKGFSGNVCSQYTELGKFNIQEPSIHDLVRAK